MTGPAVGPAAPTLNPGRWRGWVRHLRRPLVVALVWAAAATPVPAGSTALERLFAPAKDLWPRWTTHEAGATATIDHGAWSRLLRTYLRPGTDGVARFGYGRITAADRQALDLYLAALQAVAIGRYDRNEQLAYWIDLYNAVTIKVVLDHFPVVSIRDIDISPGLFADGPWGAKLARVDGESLSLNDIEHRILRPIWNDPRIHYAVNCASVGCPNLQAEAFTGANADRLLTAGARAYVNDPRGVQMRRGALTLSSLYNWFRDDFGGTEMAVIGHLRRFADPDLVRQLDGVTGVAAYAYDWSLNGIR